MQFNSIEFLFYFLPVMLAVYAIFPKRFRTPILIIGSLSYYALASNGNYWWGAILLVVTGFAYLAGLSLEKQRFKWLLWVYLTLLMSLLIFFKIYQGGRYLPSGMSFYLFQVAAYLIDVYRSRITPEKKVLALTEEIVLFPKLLSGPLMDSRSLKIQYRSHVMSMKSVREGLQYLILGLGFKVLIANRLGGLWAEAGIAGYSYISIPFAWISLTAYSMQLYFDFYGYSLMAIGLGKMFGYDLPSNFDSPYAAKTVSEFYRRWHITLGMWFREYLYIPLGGNRKGTLMTIFNLAVVWLFTGLWHGVGGNYLLWAGFLFLMIVNERLWLGKLLKRSVVLGHVYVVVAILLSWVPFAVGDWEQMVAFLGRLFGLTGMTVNSLDFTIVASEYTPILLGGLIFATPWPRKLWEKIRHTFVADILMLGLFWIVIYCISTAAQDPFMYFQY